jgi:putative AlgH/UPF0301 family transcriptional regulator
MKGLRKGVSLVARRSVSGPVFDRSVILLIDYAEERGATGLVVNKPTPSVADSFGPMGGTSSTKTWCGSRVPSNPKHRVDPPCA